MEALLTHKDIDINAVDNKGMSPIYYVVGEDHPECAKLLFSNKDLLLNITDHEGRTPLHYACEIGRKSMVELLLSHPNININAKNNKGQTPLAVAKAKSQLFIQQPSRFLFYPNNPFEHIVELLRLSGGI